MRSPKVVLRSSLLLSICVIAISGSALARKNPQSGSSQPASLPASAKPDASEQGSESLPKILERMDRTAANFHTAQANLIWTTYNSVAEQNFTDKGKIYFRRSGANTQMAADLQPPSARQILFMNDKVQVYTPGTGQIDSYNTSAHRQEVETFLILGFGSSGSGLHKTFAVNYAGTEKISGIETAKLELVPLSDSIKSRFPKIDLWIDPERGVSVRQKLFEEGGDYRLADYSDIQLNQKLPKDVFKLKAAGNTKTVNH